MSGRIIVVEGLDGTGKTTLSQALAKQLGAHWCTTPDGILREVRAVADLLYADDPAASELFYAAAVLHAGREAERRRRAGQDVVIDRYWLSTLAYAKAAGPALDLAEVEACLPAADFTVLVELDERERAKRLWSRGASALDKQTLDPVRSARIRREYRRGLQRPVAGRGVVLDVTGLSAAAAVEAVLLRLAGGRAAAGGRAGRGCAA